MITGVSELCPVNTKRRPMLAQYWSSIADVGKLLVIYKVCYIYIPRQDLLVNRCLSETHRSPCSNHCCFNVGQTSQTVVKHYSKVILTYLVCPGVICSWYEVRVVKETNNNTIIGLHTVPIATAIITTCLVHQPFNCLTL